METEGFEPIDEATKEFLYKKIVDGLQFVSVSDKNLCSNCGFVPIQHYLFECCHPYCRPCYLLFSKEERKCRKCFVKVSQTSKQSLEFERLISSLQVYCTNVKSGCKEIVKLKDLQNHEEQCKVRRQNLLPKVYNERSENLASGENVNLTTLIEEMKLVKNILLEDRHLKRNSKLDTDALAESTNSESLTATVTKLNSENDKRLSDMEGRIESKISLNEAILNDLVGQIRFDVTLLSKRQESIDSKLNDIVQQLRDLKRTLATGNRTDDRQKSIAGVPPIMSQHGLISCGSCRKYIWGFRYACMQCSDYDLCEICEPTTHHQHLMLRIPSPLDSSRTSVIKLIRAEKIFKHKSAMFNSRGVHSAVTCNECDKPVVGILYHCMVCKIYDLCGNCEHEQLHSKHYMMRIADHRSPFYLIENQYPNVKEIIKSKLHVAV